MRRIEPEYPLLHEALTFGLMIDVDDHQSLLDARHSSIAQCPQWVTLPMPTTEGGIEIPGRHGHAGFSLDVRLFMTNLNIIPSSQI
jgi:hypothetical protein